MLPVCETSLGIIKDKNGYVLLEYHLKTNGYNLPGGKLDKGEKPADALIRELKEELNIDVSKDDIQYLFTDSFEGTYPDFGDTIIEFRCHIFEVKFYKGEIENMEPEKHPALIYFKLDTIADDDDIPKSKILKLIIHKIM